MSEKEIRRAIRELKKALKVVEYEAIELIDSQLGSRHQESERNKLLMQQNKLLIQQLQEQNQFIKKKWGEDPTCVPATIDDAEKMLQVATSRKLQEPVRP